MYFLDMSKKSKLSLLFIIIISYIISFEHYT